MTSTLASKRDPDGGLKRSYGGNQVVGLNAWCWIACWSMAASLALLLTLAGRDADSLSFDTKKSVSFVAGVASASWAVMGSLIVLTKPRQPSDLGGVSKWSLAVYAGILAASVSMGIRAFGSSSTVFVDLVFGTLIALLGPLVCWQMTGRSIGADRPSVTRQTGIGKILMMTLLVAVVIAVGNVAMRVFDAHWSNVALIAGQSMLFLLLFLTLLGKPSAASIATVPIFLAMTFLLYSLTGTLDRQTVEQYEVASVRAMGHYVATFLFLVLLRSTGVRFA